MILQVAYCTDEKYAKIMMVSIVSLCETNKEFDDIVFYCLEKGLSLETKSEIECVVNHYNRKIQFLDIRNICEKKRFWKPSRDTMFSRVLIPELIDKDKVLYLDCDLIVLDSLKELWNINVDGYANLVVQDTSRKNARLETGNVNIRYFNSGVMVINCVEWRNKDYFSQMREFEKKYENEAIFPDQRPLNAITLCDSKIIDPKYNFTPELYRYTYKQLLLLMDTKVFYEQQQVEDARKEPVIVHFSGRSIERPWFKNCRNQYKELYRTYMKKFDFLDFPLWEDSKLNSIKWEIKYRLPFFIQLLGSRLR